MRVILVNRFYAPDESATSRVATSFAEALAAEGRDVHVIASNRLHDDPARRLPGRETVAGVRVRRLPTGGFGRATTLRRSLDYASFHLHAAWALAARARRGDVVVVCTDPPLASVTAMAPAAIVGARRVNWLFDLFPEAATGLGAIEPGRLARLATRLRDVSLRTAAANVAPMRSMAAHLEEARGLPPGCVDVIPNWSDGEAIRPVSHAANGVRREWGLEGRFVVGYSGNLGRAHEFGTILEAAALLRDRPEIVFLFVGGGHRRAEVEARAQALGLANVQFRPLQPRERLCESLGAADAHLVSLLPEMEPFVIPSKFNGIAAAGRPTLFVGSPTGEVARTVRRARCGRAFAIGDADGLAGAIADLASDPAACARLGENARRVFEAELDAGIAMARWHALLDRLAPASPEALTRAEPG